MVMVYMVPQLDCIDTCDPDTNVTSETVTPHAGEGDGGDTNAISISSTLSVATSGFTS